MFENYIKGIKSHADEILSAVGDFRREVLALEERAKAAEPTAAEYERLREAISTKTVEYADLNKRYAELEKAYRAYQDIASRK